jgi:hypothetical protein
MLANVSMPWSRVVGTMVAIGGHRPPWSMCFAHRTDKIIWIPTLKKKLSWKTFYLAGSLVSLRDLARLVRDFSRETWVSSRNPGLARNARPYVHRYVMSVCREKGFWSCKKRREPKRLALPPILMVVACPPAPPPPPEAGSSSSIWRERWMRTKLFLPTTALWPFCLASTTSKSMVGDGIIALWAVIMYVP